MRVMQPSLMPSLPIGCRRKFPRLIFCTVMWSLLELVL